MITSGKCKSTYNSKSLKKQVILCALQFPLKRKAYWNVQISSSKLPMAPQAHRLVEQTFGAKMASENFRFHLHIIQKKMFFQSAFSFILTVEH